MNYAIKRPFYDAIEQLRYASSMELGIDYSILND